MLDDVGDLNRLRHDETGDPEILTRVAQYELAYRMQSSVPELTDLSREPKHVLDLYGPEVQKPASYAANCLLARRLAERGVRFIQLYHMGWDHHGNLPRQIRNQCRDTDQAVGRPDSRPEAARPARRHAGDLGRRVRADGLFTGIADGGPTTAATIILVASRSGWPAAASARATFTARRTISRTTSSATRSTSTT